MAFPIPETDVGAALVAASVGWTAPLAPLVSGTDIKYLARRSTMEPGDAAVKVWIAPYGGQAPEPMENVAVEGSYWRPRVQLEIVGPPDNAEVAVALARAVYYALHTKDVTAVALGRNYARVTALQEPMYRGVIPDSNQHLWVFNLVLEWNGQAS